MCCQGRLQGHFLLPLSSTYCPRPHDESASAAWKGYVLSVEQSEELLQELPEDPRPLPGTELSNSGGHKSQRMLGEFCPLGVSLPGHETISVPNCHVIGGGRRLPPSMGAGLGGPSLNTASACLRAVGSTGCGGVSLPHWTFLRGWDLP